MNAFNGASEPDIEEAYLKAEPKILSPASPKPIHFPQPSNIPVLDNMMDVGFNQTEAHMDANSRDTELRPGAWRDPAESDQPSPFSTGDNPNESTTEANDAEASANSTQAISNGHDTDPVQISNGLSYAANSFPQQLDAPSASTAQEAYAASHNPSVSFAAEPEQTSDALQAQSVETSSAAQSTPLPSAVNVQALLDTLHTSMTPAANVAPTHEGLTAATTQSPSQSQAQPPAQGANAQSPVAASPSGLPPRPPPQQQPLMNPNYAHSQHIRDYHPHATSPATQTTHAQTQPAHAAADPAEAQSGIFASLGNGANYPTQQSPTSTLVAPPVHQASAQQYSQQYSSTNAPIESRREYKIAAGETPTLDDQPWTADIQRKYDHFMEEERRYVNEAKWDQFPNGSRLFVGNLSSEKVTKRDIFHVFHSYGELAQISIKQAYGFVQFLRVEDCMRALHAEQGRQIRDKRIHLELSKPQKPPRNQQQQNHGRRSRSPDNRRGQGSGRYDDRRGGRRDGRDGRERDSYYTRSPSPPSRDHRYARTYNRRSRSPSYGPSYGRDGRYRSPPPEPDDDLPLPRRQPRDVPDVQIIVFQELNRQFLTWVEEAFSSRSVRVDVLTISPRFDEQAVVRRQIVEGVIAVCKLRRVNQDASKIGLTIFKRRSGTKDVQFEEYDNLEPSIGAELVIRERQSLRTPAAQPSYGGYSGQQYAAPPPQQQYGYSQPPAPFPAPPVGYPPGYGQPPRPTPAYAGQPPVPMLPQGYPPTQPQPPRVDSNNLQNLLSTLNTASPAGAPQQQSYGMPLHPGYPPTQSYQQYPPASTHSTPAQAPQPPTPGQAPQNMQDILARLSTYRQ